jgi:coenzyme F420 hydrogenase subunit beta
MPDAGPADAAIHDSGEEMSPGHVGHKEAAGLKPAIKKKDGNAFPGFSRRIATLKDVVDWGLCTGCGACYYACSKHGISLVNIESVGIRPRFDSSACAGCTECLSICPGNSVDGELATGQVSNQADAHPAVGSVLEVWEGYAGDPEIRFQGSSGGALSALALYCLEREDMEFVLHTGVDEAKSWLSKTVQSRNRSELLARTGSRYAPASPCDGLGLIEKSPRPCVFVGKPCDTTAVTMLRNQRPELDQKLGLVLTFFCAGTPSTQGTLDLVKELAVPLQDVTSVRYRGQGWPGRFKVISQGGAQEKSFSYEESWGWLTGYRPLRCHICPDGLGRVADISCGDAWEKLADGRDAGRSIVVVRTQRGREILHRAVAAKYLELEPVGATAVLTAQPNQIEKYRQLWGRLLGMRLLRVPIPTFGAFLLSQAWGELPFLKKARIILGTLRRVALRGLWRRRHILQG